MHGNSLEDISPSGREPGSEDFRQTVLDCNREATES